MAHGKLRGQLNAPAVSQDAVWGEVARKSAAVGAAAPNETGYLGRTLEDEEVKREVGEYARRISLADGSNGMAVLIGGRVVGVEIFGDAETFGRLRDKLLRSYMVDAIEYGSASKRPDAASLVEEFLRRAANARQVSRPTIGIGRFLKIDDPALYGSVLHWHRQEGANGVVHASVFPGR